MKTPKAFVAAFGFGDDITRDTLEALISARDAEHLRDRDECQICGIYREVHDLKPRPAHAFVEPTGPAHYSSGARCGEIFASPSSLSFAIGARMGHEASCLECSRIFERGQNREPIFCDTPGCGKPIPVGGEGHPEICPDCLRRFGR